MGRFSENVVGKRFGKLLIIDQYIKKFNGISKSVCKCICDCNKEVVVDHVIRVADLKSGKITSCGCVALETRSRNHVGKTFFRLTIIERLPKYDGKKTYYKCVCSCKNENQNVVIISGNLVGRVKSCGCMKTEAYKRRLRENNVNWKGGLETAWYDTYAPQIEFCEEVRRNAENNDLLQVKCTYCGNWFDPTRTQLKNRVSALHFVQSGENRFYCDNPNCKEQCPIYNQKTYPKCYKPESNRPYVDSYWTDEVLKQANYQCEICGSEDNLTAHHIESATLNPILANDIDNGICLCKSCHYSKAHSDDGCKTSDLRCRKGEN